MTAKPESSHFNSFWTPAPALDCDPGFAGVTGLGLFTKQSILILAEVSIMTEHTHTSTPNFTSRIIPASETAEKMRRACNRFLESLTPEQRRKSNFDFGSPERQRWHYLPREMFDRQGLCLKQMTPNQRKTAFALLASGLSQMGYDKARAIIHLETTLGEIERLLGTARLIRDPDLYYFSVFGDPTTPDPWSWRAEGHHVSLNFTIVNREWIAPNPFFLGANPAEVHTGPQKGLRILTQEEELARSLLKSLTADQQKKTIINSVAPADILTRAMPKVEFGSADGLAAESMTPAQRQNLDCLIHEYIDRLPIELAKIEKTKLKNASLNDIHFAWAGSKDRGKPHYYRLHGTFFFVEYDNTQNNANHIHTVWSHLENDFGLDLLNLHYKQGHHS
jgi:hypothetical protein